MRARPGLRGARNLQYTQTNPCWWIARIHTLVLNPFFLRSVPLIETRSHRVGAVRTACFPSCWILSHYRAKLLPRRERMLASFAEIGLLIEIDVSSSRTNQTTWTRDFGITNGIHLIPSNACSYFLFYFTPNVRGIVRGVMIIKSQLIFRVIIRESARTWRIINISPVL